MLAITVNVPLALALMLISVMAVGCASTGAPTDRITPESIPPLLTKAIQETYGRCGEVTHLLACPSQYQSLGEGECLLAFTSGSSVYDPGAHFFTIFESNGRYFVGGRHRSERPGAPEVFVIVGMCGSWSQRDG